MSSSLQLNLQPQVKGYRIVQRFNNDEEEKSAEKQTMLKVIVKNQSNGIPRIRNDVVCNGKHYPFIPLLSFTTEDDLKLIQQISAIVLRDQNELLCQILSNQVTQVKSTHFNDIKQRMKNVFGLNLKIDPEQLFLILISDQITSDDEFNQIFDSISETEFIFVIKKVYQNCPNRIIPKIQRKFTKYLNSTKGRPANAVERLKRFLKIVKSTQDDVEINQKQDSYKPKKQQIQQESSQEQKALIPQKSPVKNQKLIKSAPKVQQKPIKKASIKQVIQKPTVIVPAPKLTQKVNQKVSQSQKVTTTQKVKTVQKVKKVEKQKISLPTKQTKNTEQKSQEWDDVQESDDHADMQEKINNMTFHDDQQEQLQVIGGRKKDKKSKNNAFIPLDPEFEMNSGKRQPRPKKQKYNNKNSRQNLKQNDKTQKIEDTQNFDRRNKYRPNNKNGASNNNQQSAQKSGRRQFSQENKKIDQRIVLGINGASDSVWRERMRPAKYPKDENSTYYKNRDGNFRQNRANYNNKGIKSANDSLIVPKNSQNKIQASTQSSRSKKDTSNLSLQRVFSHPEDSLNKFRFENRNYNLFVNKLFWINITEGQVTIQKDGKGYIRNCSVEIIENGKGLIAEGLTLVFDGLSNLEDGGTAFGNPVFQQFTPDGQWFHLSSLQVYAYV